MQYEPIYYLRKYKKHIIFWGLFFLALISLITYANWHEKTEQRKGKIAVAVQTVPQDSVISVGGAVYSHNDLYLSPGEYDVTVSKEGFSSYTQKIVVNKKDEVKIFAGLAPESEEAKHWQARHRRDYADLERQSFLFSQEYGTAFRERWPITKTLPIKDPYFTISYRLTSSGDIILTVKGTSPRYREFAIEELRKRGFEPTDYRFEFIGFSNPLQRSDS